LRRAEEGVNILGVFHVKNHYFTPKNHSFYNYGGRREKFWGISCEKSRFYAKKTYFFPILGGGMYRVRPHPPLDPPLIMLALSRAKSKCPSLEMSLNHSQCKVIIDTKTNVSPIFFLLLRDIFCISCIKFSFKMKVDVLEVVNKHFWSNTMY
jgi:hypothetical protein